MALPLYLLALVGAALYFVSQKIAFRLKYKFPTQVPGWPIVGNTTQMPHPAGMWCWDLAKKYGEMYER